MSKLKIRSDLRWKIKQEFWSDHPQCEIKQHLDLFTWWVKFLNSRKSHCTNSIIKKKKTTLGRFTWIIKIKTLFTRLRWSLWVSKKSLEVFSSNLKVVQHTHLTYQSVSSLSTSCSEMLKICSVIHLLAQGFGKCVQMFQTHVKHLQQVFQLSPGTILQPTYLYSLRKSLIFSRRPKVFRAVVLFCFGDQQSFMQK